MNLSPTINENEVAFDVDGDRVVVYRMKFKKNAVDLVTGLEFEILDKWSKDQTWAKIQTLMTCAAEAKEGNVDIFELHEKMTKHLFPAYASEDERFLALALCGEAGELANMVKKRWRDGANLSEEIREEICDIRVYLELLAKCFGIEGSKLDEAVKAKLIKVAEKHKFREFKSPYTTKSVGK